MHHNSLRVQLMPPRVRATSKTQDSSILYKGNPGIVNDGHFLSPGNKQDALVQKKSLPSQDAQQRRMATPGNQGQERKDTPKIQVCVCDHSKIYFDAQACFTQSQSNLSHFSIYYVIAHFSVCSCSALLQDTFSAIVSICLYGQHHFCSVQCSQFNWTRYIFSIGTTPLKNAVWQIVHMSVVNM